VAPDIHSSFSRENSAREVDDTYARNTEEVRTLYIHAAAFGIIFLTRFKIQGGAPDTREVYDINARNTEEVRTLYIHAAAFGISLLILSKIQGGAPDTREYVPFSGFISEIE
jgi:hypothetical protein